MRNVSNSQRGSARRIFLPSDSIIILHSNRLSSEEQHQNTHLGFRLQRNVVCGPVSHSQPKFLDFLRLTKSSKEEEDSPKAKIEDEKRHMLLMDNLKNVGEKPPEKSETEKADRAVFAQSIMLSMLHHEKFQP